MRCILSVVSVLSRGGLDISNTCSLGLGHGVRVEIVYTIYETYSFRSKNLSFTTTSPYLLISSCLNS